MLIADQNRLTRIRAPYVTIAAVVACCAVFLLYRDPAAAPVWLTFIPALPVIHPTEPAAWAGLLGHALMHGGWMHLIGNMLALAAFGDNVEDAFGHRRYALFLAVCAAAAAATWALTAPPGEGLIGASGAIAGVLAAYLLLYPQARVVMLVKWLPVAAPASWVVGLWLFANLVHALALLGPEQAEAMPTAWMAHVGGFAAGALFTLFARPRDVALFQPGPAGDAPGGWLVRYAIRLGPDRPGEAWTTVAVLKAVVFMLLAAAGMLFAF